MMNDRERLYGRPKRRLRADLLAFGDDQQDARDWVEQGFPELDAVEDAVTRLERACGITADPKCVVPTGDDIGGTNRAPLFGRAPFRLWRAALSFLGVRR